MSIYSTCCRKPSRSSGIIVVLPGAVMCRENREHLPRARERLVHHVGTQLLTECVENPPSRAPNLAGLDRLADKPCSAHRGHFAEERCQRTPSSRVLDGVSDLAARLTALSHQGPTKRGPPSLIMLSIRDSRDQIEAVGPEKVGPPRHTLGNARMTRPSGRV